MLQISEISLFLAEPLTMFLGTLGFRGTLVGKRCPKVFLLLKVYKIELVVHNLAEE